MPKPATTPSIQLLNAFPEVEPPVRPLANYVLVQYRTERVRRNSIILPDQAKDDAFRSQIVKVVGMGPLVFHTRDLNTGKAYEFSEPQWFRVGDFVRVPQYGLDILYKVPTDAEMARIREISQKAEKQDPSAVFVAEKGLVDRNKIKFALLNFVDVKAVALDPLDTLNGI